MRQVRPRSKVTHCLALQDKQTGNWLKLLPLASGARRPSASMQIGAGEQFARHFCATPKLKFNREHHYSSPLSPALWPLGEFARQQGSGGHKLGPAPVCAPLRRRPLRTSLWRRPSKQASGRTNKQTSERAEAADTCSAAAALIAFKAPPLRSLAVGPTRAHFREQRGGRFVAQKAAAPSRAHSPSRAGPHAN